MVIIFLCFFFFVVEKLVLFIFCGIVIFIKAYVKVCFKMPEIPELDKEDTYRPLEPHDKEVLTDKRFEKMDLRLHRIENMLQNILVRLKSLVVAEERLIKGEAKKDGKDSRGKDGKRGKNGNGKKYGERAVSFAEQMKFFERHEKRLIEQAKKIADQERELQKTIENRRQEDRWFNLIMHECGFKVSDRDTLMCMKTNKPCNFKNCPRKDKIKEMID